MRLCIKCNKEKEDIDFYIHNKKKKLYRNVCKKCFIKRPYHLKLYIQEKRGKCILCPESTPECIDSHHIRNKRHKIDKLWTSSASKELIDFELAKCVSLCANCHRKVHASILEIPRELMEDKILIEQRGWTKEHLVKAVPHLDEGDIYEFGVDEGLSLKLLKGQLDKYGLKHQIFGIDSFEGLPVEEEGIPRFYLFEKGLFDKQGRESSVEGVIIIKRWFKDLTFEDTYKYKMHTAALIHIDCDLYISAKEALDFMFRNSLVKVGTIIAYDEFKSTDLWLGGESLAHKEIAEKYNVEFFEFYRNVYMDRIECWQNAFIVKSIGQKCDLGVTHGEIFPK